MAAKEMIEKLANEFSIHDLVSYYSMACPKFRPQNKNLSELLTEKETLVKEVSKIGEAEYDNASRIIFVACKIDKDLTGKESKKAQYELSKKILKQHYYDAGIFVFYGQNGSFRLSLIAASYLGTKREFTTFRRYTYFVSPEITNKTFIKQLGSCKFSSIENILAAFSIEAVSEEFYNSFKPKFDHVVSSIRGDKADNQTKQDFALLFAIRIIFLGFVEKKGWLGGKEKFIQSFWAEYNQHQRKNKCKDEFYIRWLEPLFFESLNSPPGTPVRLNDNEFGKETAKLLQMAPYLNGELFKRKQQVDDRELYLPDDVIGEFFDFLFQYNFTIDENTAYDEELELNPEFLGIIFEKFVNKEQGSVYTPRPEVDLMCRLSLLRWLEKKNGFEPKELHHLFFREGGSDKEYEADQKDGNFSENEIRKLLEYLENVTICDPAAGSGAFEVGMLHTINEIIEKLYKMPRCPADIEKKTAFERKKAIIAKSLYGVEVQGYAVWINQLRLWLTLFIDMPDEMKYSQLPLLPCLNFKVRRGDSLVQRIGNKMFPVQGHADIKDAAKRKITELKKIKIDFYYNQGKDEKYIKQLENDVCREIIQSQIDEIRERIKRINEQDKTKGASGPQIAFFDESQSSPKNSASQKAIEYDLVAESFELSQELRNLKDEHALIWNIEFAEIFYDKGGFDIIIGNPPYVRQEDIADPEGKVKPKEYKELLCQMAALDYPHHFKNRKIGGKSDLYTFFYLRSLHLLNKSGVHCFICSNSWLDVGYGVWMQEFLLQNVPVNLIIDNHARRSFSSADVNTIISVFDAPDKNYDRQKHLVKFVAFKKPFEECIFTENLWQLHEAKQIIKNDIFRVYPITAEMLYDEGWETDEESKSKEAGEYVGDKWGGKYLRAPDIFFTILQKGKDKLVKLKDIAEVRPGCYSGINDFFYLEKSHKNELEIEDEYLLPLIRSSSDIERLCLEECNRYFVLSMASIEKDRLLPNLRKYIEWGQEQVTRKRQKTQAGIPWPKTESVKNRKYWYSIPSKNLIPTNLFMQYVANDKFYCPYSKQMIVSDRCFHRIFPNNEKGILQYALSLNSTLQSFFVMLFGRANLGQGALKFETRDAKNIFLLNPSCVNSNKTSEIMAAIGKRPPESLFIECGIDPKNKISIEEQEPKPLPDRKELDDIVFDALDLTVDERKEVYRAVCRLVWNRISKAKSV